MNKKELQYWRADVYARCNVKFDFFTSVIDEYDPDQWQLFDAVKDIQDRFERETSAAQKPADGVYQLDLAALRGYNRALADLFPESGVTLRDTPYWSRASETLMVTAINDNACAIVPCDWLTPNPAPTFRFIVTAANGTPISDDTVQGIPREYADYAPILLREGFEWVGINYGSQRVSIERVFPPLGEGE